MWVLVLVLLAQPLGLSVGPFFPFFSPRFLINYPIPKREPFLFLGYWLSPKPLDPYGKLHKVGNRIKAK